LTANRGHEPSAGRWRLRLEVDEPESRVAAAIDGAGTIIGLATAGATRDQDAPTVWELYSINVLAEQQGSGVADDLIRVTVGDGDTTVWVSTENVRAQGFYLRHGFRAEGATKVHEGTGAPEMRMVRRSGAADR
jgi:ribosomal protein S18 acetylase RimI-like enzyme